MLHNLACDLPFYIKSNGTPDCFFTFLRQNQYLNYLENEQLGFADQTLAMVSTERRGDLACVHGSIRAVDLAFVPMRHHGD